MRYFKLQKLEFKQLIDDMTIVKGHLWKAQWKEKPSDKGHRKLTMNS